MAKFTCAACRFTDWYTNLNEFRQDGGAVKRDYVGLVESVNCPDCGLELDEPWAGVRPPDSRF
jgi:hypothetical protein